MTNYAPTMVIGLGGSGAAVVKALQKRLAKEEAPFVYRIFDFDGSSSTGSTSAGEGEEWYFPAKALETCVRNLGRERADGGGAEFEQIRAWFPTFEARELRRAQLQAAGAGQWRPIGRAGFYLNDKPFADAIEAAVKRLDQMRECNGAHSMVYIVSSVAGGTGSGLLLDVAANVKKALPDVPIMAHLILPEVFKMYDFTDNIFPNAYAALTEIAHLKNQHIVFTATYPRIKPITANDSVVPFTRVYLFGGWVCDRQPFADAADAYPYLADTLMLTATSQIRDEMVSHQANARGDAAFPLSDPASKHCFGETTAMGIQLISFALLAEECVVRYAREFIGKPDVMIRLFHPISSDGTLAEDLRQIVDREISQYTPEKIAAVADEAFRNVEDMARTSLRSAVPVVESIRSTLGIGDDAQLPEFLRPSIARIHAEAAKRLDEERGRHLLPGSFIAELERAQTHFGDEAVRPPVSAIGDLDNLRDWLNEETFAPAMFARRLFPPMLADAEDAVRRTVTEHAAGYGRWVAAVAMREMRRAIDEHKGQHQSLRTGIAAFLKQVVDDRGPYLRMNSESDQRSTETKPKVKEDTEPESVFLDCRLLTTPETALEANFNKLEVSQQDRLRRDFLSTIPEYAEQYATDRDGRSKTVLDWIEDIGKKFVDTFGRVGTAQGQEPYSLLSPDTISEDRIRETVRRCDTPLFQQGRVQAPAGTRLVRVYVPDRFPNSRSFRTKLQDICRVALRATPARAAIEGSPLDDRVVVVVENLFRPGEEIYGIYDYYESYSRRANKPLFHLDRRWLETLKPLITKPPRERVECGTPACPADLSEVSRTAFVCPGCHNPIRNRCGNIDCFDDSLAANPQLAAGIAAKRCPSCGGRLNTYWWTCELHGNVPSDKLACPGCVAADEPVHATFWRPDLRDRFVCPGCVRMNKEKRFEVSGKVAKWLTEGVNGQEVNEAKEYFRKTLTDDRLCPECGTLLVPFCPYADTILGRSHHFLHRAGSTESGARFQCNNGDAPERFYTCGSCLFPVPNGQARCARCARDLRSCRFCTLRFHLLVSARDVESTGRCPHCQSFPDEPVEAMVRPRERKDDQFCSNLYGCPIGGRLMEATLPPFVRRCPVCAPTGLPLLRVQTRNDHVGACAFCSVLLGATPDLSLNENAEGTCCLCGQRFSQARELMTQPAEFPIALAVGRALIERTDERMVFEDIYALAGVDNRPKLPELLRQFAARISHPVIQAIVQRRLHRVENLWRSQFACRQVGANGDNDIDGAAASSDQGATIGTMSIAFMLMHEHDVPGWIRALKRSGIRRETLDHLKNVLLEKTTSIHIRAKVNTMIEQARRQWDDVDER